MAEEGSEEQPQQAGAHRVPLEPYPAPAFQAIDQQGYEYPPRCVGSTNRRDPPIALGPPNTLSV